MFSPLLKQASIKVFENPGGHATSLTGSVHLLNPPNHLVGHGPRQFLNNVAGARQKNFTAHTATRPKSPGRGEGEEDGSSDLASRQVADLGGLAPSATRKAFAESNLSRCGTIVGLVAMLHPVGETESHCVAWTKVLFEEHPCDTGLRRTEEPDEDEDEAEDMAQFLKEVSRHQ